MGNGNNKLEDLFKDLNLKDDSIFNKNIDNESLFMCKINQDIKKFLKGKNYKFDIDIDIDILSMFLSQEIISFIEIKKYEQKTKKKKI